MHEQFALVRALSSPTTDTPARSRKIQFRLLVAALVLALGVSTMWFVVKARRHARQVTFVQIAPLLHHRCGACHRPEGAGPFPLLTYAQVAPRARQISRVLRDGFMPPWKPLPDHPPFANDRGLAPSEREVLLHWIDSGAPQGDPRAAPPPPSVHSGWQLGEPDLIVTLPQAFELYAEGPDIYRSFVLPVSVPSQHYVAAWEFRPQGRGIHHAILNVDRTGWARREDARDVAPGYGGMGTGNVSAPDGFYFVWTPGQQPTHPTDDSAWRLAPGTDLVLQLHMHPTGRIEHIQPMVGLYFTDRPPSRPRITLRWGDRPIDIAPGDPDWTMRDAITLPADMELLGLFPHAHYLARRVSAWAVLPDGRRETLLRIDDWDPAWQDEYTLASPLWLPRGTRLELEFHYDNSQNNPRNPSDPPRRVQTGEQTTDEMGNITLAMRPRDPRELPIIQEFKFRRLLDGSATSEYNYGNALVRLRRLPEGIAHLRRATEIDPDFGVAHFNLGNALLAQGAIAEALAQFEATRAEQGVDAADLYTNRAQALLRLGRLDDAMVAARSAVSADDRSLVARGTFAQVLTRQHSPQAADAWRAVLALAPENPAAWAGLADAQRASGDASGARASYLEALRVAPAMTSARDGLSALDGDAGPQRDAGR